jgi:hypothetical protein
MSSQHVHADRAERLLREAEAEMRRFEPSLRPGKRPRPEEDEAADGQETRQVGRFDYGAADALASEEGISGFLITCKMRRRVLVPPRVARGGAGQPSAHPTTGVAPAAAVACTRPRGQASTAPRP